MKVSLTALEKFNSLLKSVSPKSVNITPKIDADHLPKDSGIQCEIPFLLRLLLGDHPHGGESINGVKNPVDICIVLDVSGSMDCELASNDFFGLNEDEVTKLSNEDDVTKLSVCKTAIKQLISDFISHQDTVHLVTYSDTPSTVFTGLKKEVISLRSIDSIKSEGSTNISGAIFHALNILKESKAPGTKLM